MTDFRSVGFGLVGDYVFKQELLTYQTDTVAVTVGESTIILTLQDEDDITITLSGENVVINVEDDDINIEIEDEEDINIEVV